jgi:phosphoinositide-3-kinase regulatory subunit 4
MCLKEDEG